MKDVFYCIAICYKMNLFPLGAIFSQQKPAGFVKMYFSCTLLECLLSKIKFTNKKLRYYYAGSEIYS